MTDVALRQLTQKIIFALMIGAIGPCNHFPVKNRIRIQASFIAELFKHQIIEFFHGPKHFDLPGQKGAHLAPTWEIGLFRYIVTENILQVTTDISGYYRHLRLLPTSSDDTSLIFC